MVIINLSIIQEYNFVETSSGVSIVDYHFILSSNILFIMPCLLWKILVYFPDVVHFGFRFDCVSAIRVLIFSDYCTD